MQEESKKDFRKCIEEKNILRIYYYKEVDGVSNKIVKLVWNKRDKQEEEANKIQCMEDHLVVPCVKAQRSKVKVRHVILQQVPRH